jgi:hypothetical protein
MPAHRLDRGREPGRPALDLPPDRWQPGFVTRDRIHLVFPPFVVAGIVLHLVSPARLLPEWWMGLAVGLPLVAAGVAILIVAEGRWAAPAGALVASVGVGFAVNSVWPIALLLPAVVLAIRWRAVRVQTGHRPHEG